jgi:hypothetical protein
VTESPPLLVHCEGSGCPPTIWLHGDLVGMCAMCGMPIAAEHGRVDEHERQDILAMLERGDFDG